MDQPQSNVENMLVQLRRRLIQEATLAVGMLESALDALWTLDHERAREVRARDDRVDSEEVAIEKECFRLLALEQPFARDFRVVTFILKVNADIERVADHAVSIAKCVTRIQGSPPPRWPTALVELGQRVPMMCHALLRAVLREDTEAARTIVADDETIDRLDRQLFDETLALMHDEPKALANGMLIYRIGRELERIGDLMTNIAEDIVYLNTGAIIRHDDKRKNSTEH